MPSTAPSFRSTSRAETAPRRRAASPAILEVLLLLVYLLAFSWLVAPSHWSSIWMDREFTGWTAPLSNRLADGGKLYADGQHSPMPPLPTVLLYVATGGHATWLSESRAVCLFQSLMLLTMYFTLRRCFPDPLPFVVTLCSIPLVYDLPKTILYDAVAQFLVACLAATILLAYRTHTSDDAHSNHALVASHRQSIWLALACIVAAALVLSKQSTGLAAIAGTCAALLLFPRTISLFRRFGRAVLFLAALAIATLMLCFLMRNEVDLAGLFHDVFLTGSEPKGGLPQIASNLAGYAHEITDHAFVLVTSGIGFIAILGWLPSAGTLPESLDCRPVPASQPPHPAGASATVSGGSFPADQWRKHAETYGAALLPLVISVVALVSLQGTGRWITVDVWTALWNKCRLITDYALWAGVFFAAALMVRCLVRRTDRCSFSILLSILGCAAVGHSLSVSYFRWTYDNNPLIVFAAGMFIAAAAALAHSWQPHSTFQRLAHFFGITFALCIPFGVFIDQIAVCANCDHVWPGVSYLDGAKLRQSADGMRRLVTIVKQCAPNADQDTVLLLPEDPNVESWFERRRPPFSSAIVFADQYWDRYVDADFDELLRHPPKVIVIGPRNYWRHFTRQWHPGLGCERLIDRVINELLPGHYDLFWEQQIVHIGKLDWMDVYLRRN